MSRFSIKKDLTSSTSIVYLSNSNYQRKESPWSSCIRI
jgi:hypothetical protein